MNAFFVCRQFLQRFQLLNDAGRCVVKGSTTSGDHHGSEHLHILGQAGKWALLGRKPSETWPFSGDTSGSMGSKQCQCLGALPIRFHFQRETETSAAIKTVRRLRVRFACPPREKKLNDRADFRFKPSEFENALSNPRPLR
jgi:hypothetical protein